MHFKYDFLLDFERSQFLNIDVGPVSGDLYVYVRFKLGADFTGNIRRIKSDETIVWEITAGYRIAFMSFTLSPDESKYLFLGRSETNPTLQVIDPSNGNLINGVQIDAGDYWTESANSMILLSSDGLTAYITVQQVSSNTAAICKIGLSSFGTTTTATCFTDLISGKCRDLYNSLGTGNYIIQMPSKVQDGKM